MVYVRSRGPLFTHSPSSRSSLSTTPVTLSEITRYTRRQSSNQRAVWPRPMHYPSPPSHPLHLHLYIFQPNHFHSLHSLCFHCSPVCLPRPPVPKQFIHILCLFSSPYNPLADIENGSVRDMLVCRRRGILLVEEMR